MYFFIYSSVDSHQCCFHIFAIVNAAVNIGEQVSVQISRVFFLIYLPRRGITESYGSSNFRFLGNLHNCFPQWLHKFTFSPAVYEDSSFSAFLPTFVISVLFDKNHSGRCEVILHCGLNLHFSNDKWCWAFFLCLFTICMPSLEKCPFRSSAHFFHWIGFFFFLIMSCMNCSCILDINLLLVTSFTNIFSHSRCCPLVLSIILFAMQKVFTCLKTFKKFIRSHLFIFSFISFALGNLSKKFDMIYVNMCSAYVLFYESSMVSVLISRSLNHFNFLHGVREYSNLILLHIAIQLSQHHLLKRLSILHCIFLTSFVID